MSNAPTRTHAVTPTVAPATQQRQSAAESQSGDGGKRMFRRQNGEMIELPPDMSIIEAVKIELEALAAEKKHGQGQQPKPLKPKAPVVTPAAAADKAAKKVKPKDKKTKTGKKGSTNPKGGGKAGILAAVGKSKVAQYLASLGGPVLMRGLQKLAQLKTNEQTHDTPGAKLSQTEMAVVPPAHEGQSKSHGDQVEALGAKPEPKPDPGAAKQSLQKSLDENIPQSIEDVDNFKKNKKANHISRNVMNVVQGDTNEVTDTFGEMEKPRPAAPPTHTPETLPPEEIAPATPNMQLGTGAVAPLKAEHTDMSKFSKDSDDLLKKEEISQEQLDMVDSGDLAEANKDKKKLNKDVQEQPAQVRKEAETERKQVDTSLQQEEQKGKTELKNKRKAQLSATRGKQTGTKSLMEQKREKVATDIKNIYEKAKTKVNTRLAELETQSMKRFDDGNAAASKKFEDDVNQDLAAFKKRRYSGFWGWAKKAKDWLLGMDELPEVNEIFQRNKGIFVDTVNQLVADISADNQKVIKECKSEIDGAKTEIAKYVKNLGPELKSEGDKAMKEMTEKLNMLDSEVAEKEKELANKLKDKQANAIKAIDQKIEKMKESMSGALSKLGKLLLEAAKKFFTWALQKFGYSLAEIEGIINKGAAVLKAIFTKPLKFVKNLFGAAMQGFESFGKNFLTHLKNALFSWLTGSLTEVKLPDTWDVKGIASVALQMVGISYQNIRKHLVKIIPEPVVEGMEKGFELVKTIITEGPMAAWEQLQEMAGEMKDAFVDAVKEWIQGTIVQKAVETIASMIIPGAGIIRAIVG
ncbi:MAG: phage tail protein, partial [Bacteroidia bacterium]